MGCRLSQTIKLSIFIFRDRFLVNVSIFSKFVYNLVEATYFRTEVNEGINV